MKKVVLLCIISAYTFISCTKNDLTDSHWIAVRSSPIPTNSVTYGYDGVTIHFTEDQCIIGNVYQEESESFDLRLNNGEIYVNDTLWATTYVKYPDSLLLDIGDYSRVKFIKLDDKNAQIEKPELWEHTNWILSYKDYNYDRELLLTDNLVDYLVDNYHFDRTGAKLCIQKDLEQNQFIGTSDTWKVLNINDNQLFIMGLYRFDKELFRVKEYQGDSVVFLESLMLPNAQVHLKKRKYIPESKKQEILKQIQNQTWRINNLTQLDTIGQMSEYWGNCPIKLKSLIDKKMSYRFSEDLTYNMCMSDISIANGQWKLSQTGNEIVLDGGLSPSSYIDLITTNTDSLVIGHLRKFESDEDLGIFRSLEIYYKAVLKK
jgi:hypothetical protein